MIFDMAVICGAKVGQNSEMASLGLQFVVEGVGCTFVACNG